MIRARSVAIVAALSVALASSAARADGGDANDVGALEKRLDEEHAALSTGATLSSAECNEACRALGSIRRAAEKICALEPGPRCDSARAKAADATRRVREACPDCTIAEVPGQPAPAPERAVTADTAVAHEASDARGGCRSCATVGAPGAGLDVGALVLAVLAAIRLAGPRRAPRARRRR
ncbi:MAG: hypothetical protein KF764_18305 [Labilithrix sp.]|nr:hypothetical protein [Labilithrix sp.]